MKKLTLTQKTKAVLARSLVCGFLLSALASMFPFAAACETLPENIVRLHVIANSNSPADQAVKLKVRDAVLLEASKYYTQADTMQQAASALCVHLQAIETAANSALRENGFSITATVEITDSYFATRHYGEVTLPAGRYRTLRVTVGEGKGKNWWCVVFPALCLPAAETSADDVLAALPKTERSVITAPKYKLKFKAVEIYEHLKNALTTA